MRKVWERGLEEAAGLLLSMVRKQRDHAVLPAGSVGLPPSVNLIKINPCKTGPEVCLLGDSKSCQVGDQQ